MQYQTYDIVDEYALECLKDSVSELNKVLNKNNFQTDFNNTVTLSLEFYNNEYISLESFTDTIKTYWKKFIQWLKDIWAKLVKFFSDHFTIIGRRKQTIISLLAELKKYQLSERSRKIKDDIFIELTNDNISALTIGDRFVDTVDKLKDALADTKKAYSFIQNEYSDNILDRADLIKDTIDKATLENSKDLLDTLINNLNKNNPNPVKFDVLGNSTIIYERPKSDQESISQLKQNKVIIEKKTSKAVSEPKFRATNYHDLVPPLETMVEIMEDFEKFRNQGYKKIIDYQKSLISTTDKYINKLGSYLGSHEDAKTGSQELYRSIMNLNSVYLDWIKAPVVDSLRTMVSSFYQISLVMKKIVDKHDVRRSNIFITDFFDSAKVAVNLQTGRTVSESNGEIHDLITSDPSIAASGGACTFVLNPDMKEACATRLKVLLEDKDGSYRTNNPDLVKELEFLSNLKPQTPVILFSKYLRERLTGAEYKAIYDHEVGHIANKDTNFDKTKINKLEKLTSKEKYIADSDMEIAADKYSYAIANNDPRVLKSALEKALNFSDISYYSTSMDSVSIKSNSLAAKFLNLILSADVKADVKRMRRLTEKAHKRRFDELARVIKVLEEEEKNKR